MANDQYTELAELAGSFIHEIKNHISTLGLHLQLLAEDFQDAHSQREKRAYQRIQRLQGECQRLVEVSNDFLRFARINELESVPCDLALLIEELIDFFGPTARHDNIEIKNYVPSDLPPVLLDRALFKQALLNLLINAQQAMPTGGELIIQATREKSGHAADPATICLSLIDTGKGMPPEVLDRIFRPFFSTRVGGTGLGLATTRRIVEAHGGTIEVQSTVGCGTRFAIRLPVYTGPASLTAAPATTSP